MSESIKIIKRREPLTNIIPPMIMEIIHDHIINYVKDQQITKYKVELGYVEESIIIPIQDDIVEVTNREILMTYPAKVIEAYMFNHHKLDYTAEGKKELYNKLRVGHIINIRQIIQFFFAAYSDMTLQTIGFVTGGKDHATVLNSIKRTLKRMNDSASKKKEIFLIDRNICNKLGVPSKIFNINGEVIFKLKVKNHSK